MFRRDVPGLGQDIAANGVVVVMVDFRNCARFVGAGSRSVPRRSQRLRVGPALGGGPRRDLGIDPARIIVAGESGGGNLTLATGLKLKREGELGLIKGLYALCPYIAGRGRRRYPSSIENNGILLDLHNNRGAMAYGIEALQGAQPAGLAAFATEDDVKGFPPTVISVNECDPLRDEGIEFYRLLFGPACRALPTDDGHDPRDGDLLHCCPDITATRPGTSPGSPATRPGPQSSRRKDAR